MAPARRPASAYQEYPNVMFMRCYLLVAVSGVPLGHVLYPVLTMTMVPPLYPLLGSPTSWLPYQNASEKIQKMMSHMTPMPPPLAMPRNSPAFWAPAKLRSYLGMEMRTIRGAQCVIHIPQHDIDVALYDSCEFITVMEVVDALMPIVSTGYLQPSGQVKIGRRISGVTQCNEADPSSKPPFHFIIHIDEQQESPNFFSVTTLTAEGNPSFSTLALKSNENTQEKIVFTGWRHQMESISALLALCAGNSPFTGEFPSQRPVTRSFDVFFDLHLNKRWSKQSRRRWFEPPSRLFWRQCNVTSLTSLPPSARHRTPPPSWWRSVPPPQPPLPERTPPARSMWTAGSSETGTGSHCHHP